MKKIKIVGDSKFVISQVEGSFAVKEPSLAPYRALVRQLLKTFEEVEGDTLYRKGFNSEPLHCVGREELEKLLQEVHAGECGEHQGRKKLYYQLLSTRYY